MGGKNSTESGKGSFNRRDSSQEQAWGWNQTAQVDANTNRQSYPQSSGSNHSQGYAQPYPAPQEYAPRQSGQNYAQPHPTPQGYAPQQSGQNPASASNVVRPKRRMDRRYSQIADNFRSLEQVTEALAQAGLESSNLIVGIDFTKSNEWTGKNSFRNRSLHTISDVQNPYEQAISIIGRTLSAFDEDNLIPCFGFGDASTHDQDVFSFYPDEKPCNGFAQALDRYREIVPQLRLAGPTSFAPIIEKAMTIVEQSGGQYHVLVIIADGQVTRSVETENGKLSSQEQKTVDAIVKASEFPLSIILVGVGDGPWDTMQEFDDNIPSRAFDNFQFVNFTSIMMKNNPQARKETEFALAALMEIPTQYKATIELGILGRVTSKSPKRVALPPPFESYGAPSLGSNSFASTGYPTKNMPSYPEYNASQSMPSYPEYNASQSMPSIREYTTQRSTVPPPFTSPMDDQVCPICFANPKNMAFGCGHQTCNECGPNLQICPVCRSEIVTRIKLY